MSSMYPPMFERARLTKVIFTIKNYIFIRNFIIELRIKLNINHRNLLVLSKEAVNLVLLSLGKLIGQFYIILDSFIIKIFVLY